MLRIALIAHSADDRQRDGVRKNLATAIDYLGLGWELSDSSKANLALVWINSDIDLKAFLQLRKSLPPERIVATSDKRFQVPALWWLPFMPSTAAPSVLGLANLLSRVHEHFAGDGEALAAPPPADDLCAIVKQALADQTARLIRHADCPDLYLLPTEQAFYLSAHIDSLAPMALAGPTQITVDKVDSRQLLETVSYVRFSSRLSNYLSLDEDLMFDDIKAKRYKRLSVNELLWFSTLVASRGGRPDGGLGAAPVLLKQLPEYLRLDYYGKDFKPIADCMRHQPLSLEELRQRSGRSAFEVANFVNACLAMGLVEAGDAASQTMASKASARAMLRQTFASVGQALKGRIKIVVAGSVGSGKTTAIATLSDFSPITTETRPSDTVTRKKSTTTVAMDYGEIRFDQGLKIFLYGTPGQKRFDFMSQMLCENAFGMLLLIDNAEPDPLAELDYYLGLFDKFIGKIQMAIGITHCDIAQTPTAADYAGHLQRKGLACPVLTVDAREPASLAVALSQMAARPCSAAA